MERIWLDMKKRFNQQDIFRIVKIQSEIYQTKHGNHIFNEYFTQLKLLWDELLILRPMPTCGCSLRYVNVEIVFLIN